MITEDISSDAFGLATLKIDPALTKPVFFGEVVQVQNVPFQVANADPAMGMAWDENIWVRPTVRLVEVP